MRRPLALLTAAAALGALVAGSAGPAAAESPAPPPATPFPKPASTPDELIVGYRSDADATERTRARGRASARAVQRVARAAGNRGDVELLRLPAGTDRARAARLLEDDPAVAYAEPNWTYTHAATSTDPYYTSGQLWGMYGARTSPANPYGSNAAAAWAGGRTGSTTVYVGVIDEGIQYAHPDLAGQVRNPGEIANGADDDGNGYIDDVYGWDFAGNNNSVYDGGALGTADDHGTHVAGTIGAKANGSGVVGVNWNVRLISGKFLAPDGGTTANAVRAVDYFTGLKRRGVNVVATNNSWGGGGYSQALSDAISRANAAGILFVAAAGNGGDDGVGDNNDRVRNYPANYPQPNVISVAAITRTGARASFSNYGVTTVDLGAPGAGIVSTVPAGGYASYSGTSMASPHVAGAVALYKSVYPTASAATVKAALLNSTVSTLSLSRRVATGGRLDVNAALAR